MKKLLLILLCLPMIGFGQNITIPDARSISSYYKGKLEIAKEWNDKLGDNLLLISIYDDYKNGNQIMYGYLYVNGYLVWDIKDWTAVDYYDNGAGEVIIEKVEITDLDSDNISEATIVYMLQSTATDCCYPEKVKLIMHENDVKYAIRGSTAVKEIDDEHIEGGEKEMYGKDSFAKAPKIIINYASKLFDQVVGDVLIWQ